MRYRKLSATGDYTFGQQQSNFWVNTPDGVAQAVTTRLRLWKGAWFLDTSDGMDWRASVLGERTAPVRDAVIRQRVLSTPGVSSINGYNSEFNSNSRGFNSSFSIDTIYGEFAIARHTFVTPSAVPTIAIQPPPVISPPPPPSSATASLPPTAPQPATQNTATVASPPASTATAPTAPPTTPPARPSADQTALAPIGANGYPPPPPEKPSPKDRPPPTDQASAGATPPASAVVSPPAAGPPTASSPPAATPPVAAPAATPAPAQPNVASLPPGATGPLLETSPYGPLPRIAADGRLPWISNDARFDHRTRTPRISILVVGLGFDAKTTEDAIVKLPPEVSLGFLPYANLSSPTRTPACRCYRKLPAAG